MTKFKLWKRTKAIAREYRTHGYRPFPNLTLRDCVTLADYDARTEADEREECDWDDLAREAELEFAAQA